MNCLSDDGYSVRSCPKPFSNKSGLMNNKIGELSESENEVVWSRIQTNSRGDPHTGRRGTPDTFKRANEAVTGWKSQ